MPSGPLGSRGCYTCRERKVKCDEGRPSCEKCIRSARVCPGYRDASDLIFRDMNAVTESRVRRKEHDPSTSLVSASLGAGIVSGESSDVTRQDAQVTHEPVEVHPLPTDYNWQEKAVEQFLTDFWAPSDVIVEHMQFLAAFCQSPSSDILREATHAAAFTSQGNQLGLEWMLAEGTLAYGRALSLLSKAVQSEPAEDSTLVATLLLGMFEAFDRRGHSDLLSRIYPSNHHTGRVSLVRLRGDQQFNSLIRRSIFRAVQTHTIFRCLTTHIEPPEDADRWLLLLGTGHEYQSEDLARTNLQAARFCARAQALFSKDEAERNEYWILDLLRVVKDAILIDLEYQQWSDHGPGSFQYRVLHAPASSGKAALDAGTEAVISTTHIYQDLWTAFIWNNCRACRIHLHEVLLHCIELITSYSSAQSPGFDLAASHDQSRYIIKDLLSGICASIPYCLGDVDAAGEPVDGTEKRTPLTGWLLMWPLYVARASSEPDSVLDLLIQRKLEYIADRLGIYRARVFARRPRKELWDLS